MTSPESLTQKWLRQNVQSYPLKERVYSDVDSVLSRFHTLRPKLDVYTYDDGRTQLLLCVHGLLSISFRNVSYNIPIAIWLTREYPRQPPICYVVPTNDMLVKAGRYVDVSGKCDIEYSQNWMRKSEGCHLSGLLEAMQELFSREPPLYAKPKSDVSPGPTSRPTADQVYAAKPPPPVPSTGEAIASSQTPQYPDRPVLPPKPGSSTLNSTVGINSQATLTGPQSMKQAARTTLSRVEPPPPPPRPTDPGLPQYRTTLTSPLPVNHPFRTIPIGDVTPPPLPETRVPNSNSHWSHSSTPVIPPLPPKGSPTNPTYLPAGPYHYLPQGHLQQLRAGLRSPDLELQPRRPSPAVAINLLDEDSPPSLSAPRPTPAAPPRPPNPEILNLHGRVHQKLTSDLASLSQALALDAERLRAHQSDLLAGEPAIRDEMARLEAVRDVCRNVSGRTRSTVGHAETNIAELRRKGDPEVDELVCSTTIVHNQLINLVAEDNAIEDTIYHLHRALNSGRIDLERFLRTTRLLAEEQFMKRALIEKIQVGMPKAMSMGSEWA